MDKDTLKGKGKDAAGRVQRQVGEWTGDEEMEAEGTARQAEGKIQKGVGKIKEAGRDAAGRLEREKKKKDKAA